MKLSVLFMILLVCVLLIDDTYAAKKDKKLKKGNKNEKNLSKRGVEGDKKEAKVKYSSENVGKKHRQKREEKYTESKLKNVDKNKNKKNYKDSKVTLEENYVSDNENVVKDKKSKKQKDKKPLSEKSIEENLSNEEIVEEELKTGKQSKTTTKVNKDNTETNKKRKLKTKSGTENCKKCNQEIVQENTGEEVVEDEGELEVVGKKLKKIVKEKTTGAESKADSISDNINLSEKSTHAGDCKSKNVKITEEVDCAPDAAEILENDVEIEA